LKLLYAFPEPLPLDRARGIQTVQTVRALADQNIGVILAHVPAGADPFDSYSVRRPDNVELAPVSHRLFWPLERVHSNRIFAARLGRKIAWRDVGAVMVRHLKLARMLTDSRPGLPLLYEAHEAFADTVSQGRRERTAELERSVIEGASALVANSGATARRLAELYAPRARIEVVPNGVDYPAQVPERDWSRARERVIYAGSFFGWKGVQDLVTAARRLAGFRIRVLGGDQSGIARLRAELGPESAQLDFAGRVPHAQVAAELQRSCIAVLPNRADPDSMFTSPIKLFEYMAAGCALVVSDLPSIREILDADEAEWVAPGDSAALAAAIRALADDPARARVMAARVREKAKAYTWDARGERLARMIRPFLERR
jgi:glycosyltransferase involved in cell wall biosynthesis